MMRFRKCIFFLLTIQLECIALLCKMADNIMDGSSYLTIQKGNQDNLV